MEKVFIKLESYSRILNLTAHTALAPHCEDEKGETRSDRVSVSGSTVRGSSTG